MPEHPRKLLLFDVDGVIIDSFDLLYRNITALAKDKTGFGIPRERYRALFKGNALQKVMHLAGVQSVSEVPDDIAAALFAGYNQAPVVLGIKDVLLTLSGRYPMAVVTSTIRQVITEKFTQEGIQDLFSAYFGPEAAVKKDEKINQAMKQFGVTPEQTWFITDTSGDIKEAQKTAIHTVAVTWGFHDQPTLAEVNPDQIVSTPEGLLAALH
ncbi:MAG: HAD family hydrolase [Parcubacteria group bacterium]|nr:HAD family hydrolase [Parcubacteria group bacterium]